MLASTKAVLIVAAALSIGSALANGGAGTDVHGLGVGETIATVMAALFALAFAAWAKRLDKALDLLEKIQASMHRNAVRTERRLTTLEQVARQCGNNVPHPEDDQDE